MMKLKLKALKCCSTLKIWKGAKTQFFECTFHSSNFEKEKTNFQRRRQEMDFECASSGQVQILAFQEKLGKRRSQKKTVETKSCFDADSHINWAECFFKFVKIRLWLKLRPQCTVTRRSTIQQETIWAWYVCTYVSRLMSEKSKCFRNTFEKGN